MSTMSIISITTGDGRSPANQMIGGNFMFFYRAFYIPVLAGVCESTISGRACLWGAINILEKRTKKKHEDHLNKDQDG